MKLQYSTVYIVCTTYKKQFPVFIFVSTINNIIEGYSIKLVVLQSRFVNFCNVELFMFFFYAQSMFWALKFILEFSYVTFYYDVYYMLHVSFEFNHFMISRLIVIEIRMIHQLYLDSTYTTLHMLDAVILHFR